MREIGTVSSRRHSQGRGRRRGFDSRNTQPLADGKI